MNFTGTQIIVKNVNVKKKVLAAQKMELKVFISIVIVFALFAQKVQAVMTKILFFVVMTNIKMRKDKVNVRLVLQDLIQVVKVLIAATPPA